MADASAEVPSTDTQKPKPKLARGVPFILFNGFCDRFTYYGIKAILILYLTNVLQREESNSKEIYHLFFMFCTFVPLIGAMIADSFLGNFKTILIFTVVYIFGNSILTVAAIPTLGLPTTATSIIGLVLLAIGTGCVKPCVTAYGGDQYELPAQEKQLKSYFSNFYFCISIGGLVAQFTTPFLRQKVQCFDNDCYTAAFAVTTASMIFALVVFLIGKPFYKKVPVAEGNVVVEVIKCIWLALKTKYKKGKSSTALHWLDHALGEFDENFVRDVKAVLKVLVLFLFFPMFWALMEQQGSAWTLQATKMNGRVFGFDIKPDQIQVVSPLLVLVLIPVFDKFVYPALGKINILRKPVERLALGGILAALAFVMSGMIQLKLENQGIGDLTNQIHIPGMHSLNALTLDSYPCAVNVTHIQGTQHQVLQGVIANGSLKLNQPIANIGLVVLELRNISDCLNSTDLKNNDTKASEYNVRPSINGSRAQSFTIESESLHMLWLLPQFITITIAEVLFAVTGIEFSYTQAPSSMKSVMQSVCLFTIAFGNLIVAIISRLDMFSLQSHEVFFYAGIMFLDIIIFIWLASSYDTTKRPLRKSGSKAFTDLRILSMRNDGGERVISRRRTIV